MYSYGNYYTWAAAIANTNEYNTKNESATSTSICPAGWRLPVGGQTTVNTTGDFYVLTRTLAGMEPNELNSGYSYYSGSDGITASSVLRAYPNNFVYSGYFNNSSAYGRGYVGNYWSSTANDGSLAYNLYLNSDYVSPGTNLWDKYNGLAVRCVLGS